MLKAQYNVAWRKDRDDFLNRCEREGFGPDFARAIMRHATTATRIAILQCNGPDFASDPTIPGVKLSRMMDRWQARIDASDAACDARIVKLCARHGVTVELAGDPRGAVVKIKTVSGRGNSFGDPSMLCVPAAEFTDSAWG